MMIEANIRNLSRAELLYTCVAKLVIYLHKNKHDDLIAGLEHYYDPKDYNQRFYYSNSGETAEQIKEILDDADQRWTSAVRILTVLPNTSFWSDVSLNRPSLKTVLAGSEKKQMAE